MLNNKSIDVHAIPIFKDNYVWLVINPINKKVIAIDPGDSEPVLDYLQSNQMELEAIFITHHHWDHTQGISALKKKYNAVVYGPKNKQIDGLTHMVEEGDTIRISSFNASFEILKIPGHTLDHIAYILPGLVFCGDTLFSAGCGRLFEGTPKQMYQSLQKIMSLPDETQVLCAHEYTLQNLTFAQIVEPNNKQIQTKIRYVIELRQGNNSTLPAVLKEEKKINPFLRCHVKEVVDSVEGWVGFKLEDPVQVFKYLREWKDGFVI